jgi:hypothetical protein
MEMGTSIEKKRNIPANFNIDKPLLLGTGGNTNYLFGDKILSIFPRGYKPWNKETGRALFPFT